ncbi:tRNA-uridine aminocarboxypropyltransferase [Gilvimarinus polysaccharolyticus]|uniref:tRNA-uridine aminocarboxypropyltransferase n=1 Tax=Gilvimarinus polysaccharolyticus TaxID=863921 RepID=UPI0006731E85|nr:tRNA-uridine aminocarboxypropyltransferase [Gilvimarinus polysaccharolyticus]
MPRRLCSTCQRPDARCYCAYIRPITNRTQVVVLQHPDESGHPKNTGELLVKCLSSATLLVGETLDNALIEQFASHNAALLYPDQPEDTLAAAAPIADPKAINHLIVLDATWRKSRKMLHLNPWLNSLPRVTLNTIPTSRYRIRSAAKQDQLSTFEASCYALQQLEANPTLCEQALSAFDSYMNHLVSFDPNRP